MSSSPNHQHSTLVAILIIGIIDLLICTTRIFQEHWYDICRQFAIIALVEILISALIYYYLTSQIQSHYSQDMESQNVEDYFLRKSLVITYLSSFAVLTLILTMVINFISQDQVHTTFHMQMFTVSATVDMLILDVYALINMVKIKLFFVDHHQRLTEKQAKRVLTDKELNEDEMKHSLAILDFRHLHNFFDHNDH